MIRREQADKALKKLQTRSFDITGRPMRGLIMVAPHGYKKGETLRRWVRQAADFAMSLPAK
jgi:hypothetical protein